MPETEDRRADLRASLRVKIGDPAGFAKLIETNAANGGPKTHTHLSLLSREERGQLGSPSTRDIHVAIEALFNETLFNETDVTVLHLPAVRRFKPTTIVVMIIKMWQKTATS